MAQNSLTPAKEIVIDLTINDRDVAETIIETKKALVELTKEQKELEQVIKKGTATRDQYERYVQLKTEINDLNKTMRANQKVLDDNIQAEKNNGDSINAMRAKLRNLRAEYEDMSGAVRESSIGTDKLKEIDDYTEKIRQAEFAQKDFRRNVGNYPEMENAKVALRSLRTEIQNYALELSKVEGKRSALTSEIQALVNSSGTETQAYKDKVAELQQLDAAYDTTKAKMNEMEKQAGNLTDILSDSSKRIQSFANDQQKIVAAQEGVQLLLSTYTALEGATTALGLQSKALVEIYSRMQIVQKSVNALMTIYKTLNKDSNLRLVLRNKLEQARLVWTKAYNAALKQQNADVVANTAAETANAAATGAVTVAETAATGATFSFSAALQALKAVLLSNPFTAIALGIASLATAIGVAVNKIVKKNKEAKESEKELAEETKRVTAEYKKSADQRAKSMESITGKYTSQIARVKALLSVVRSETAAYDAKVKAMNELNRLIPEYNGQLSKTGQILKENTSAVENYVANLQKQAEAAATMNILTSAYETKLTSESSRLKAQEDLNWYEKRYKALLDQRDALWLKYGSKDHEEVQKAQNDLEWYGARVKATEQYIKDLDSAVRNADKQIAEFSNKAKDLRIDDGGTRHTTTTTTINDTAKKTAQEQYNELLKIASDYYKSLEEVQKESIQTLTEKENARYAGEKEQLEKAVADAQKLVDTLSKDPKLLKELQKDNKFLSIETLNKQIEILNQELENAATTHTSNLSKIQLDTWASFVVTMGRLKREIDKANGDSSAAYKFELQNRLAALNKELEDELRAHEYTEQQKAAITAKYEERRALLYKEFQNEAQSGSYDNISNLGALQSQLAADLAELEARKKAELDVFKGTEEEKAAIVADYAQKRVDIENKASKQEAQIWLNASMNIASAMASAMGSMADLLNTIAEDDAEMQRYSKALAVAQIAISTGVSIAQAVQAAVQAGGFTGPAAPITIPVFIAELIGIVTSAVASAVSTLGSATIPSRPRFATGGLVGNRVTTKKDDTVNAKLSEGEYVIQSKIVKKYGVEFFDHINETKKSNRRFDLPYKFATGGSVPSVENIQSITTQMDYTQMEEMFTRVVENIQPVVSVTEITDKQNRVRIKENTSTY